MKKNIILIFLGSFIVIYLLIGFGIKGVNKYKDEKAISEKIMPSQEYRTDDEMAQIFVESFIRTCGMLINNTKGDFLYLDSMIDPNIEDNVINEIKKLRSENTKTDNDFQVKILKKDNNIYNFQVDIKNLDNNKVNEKKYIFIVRVKEMQGKFKVINIYEK